MLLDDPELDNINQGEGQSLAKPRNKKKTPEIEINPIRFEMDPQSRKSLLKDLEYLQGNTPLNESGLLSFNCFMHIFIVITRHSKEQHIKEVRKTVDKRRRCYKLRDWKEYEKII